MTLESTENETKATENAAELHSEASGEPNGTPKADDVEAWKVQSRTWEKRAKENSDAKAELEAAQAELETIRATYAAERQQTEQLASELAAAKRQIEVHRVAMAAGVDEGVLGRMVGETTEEITANAEVLKAAVGTAQRFPEVTDKGTQQVATVSEASIAAIKDPVARVNARADAITQGLI